MSVWGYVNVTAVFSHAQAFSIKLSGELLDDAGRAGVGTIGPDAASTGDPAEHGQVQELRAQYPPQLQYDRHAHRPFLPAPVSSVPVSFFDVSYFDL